MSDDDRDRGILSTADREYLQSPEGYSRQASNERENAIRNRVWNAILDFDLLTSMSPEQRRAILGSGDPQSERHKPAMHIEFERALAWTIAFAHQLATDLGTAVEPLPPDGDFKSRSFEIHLQEGLERAYIEENLVLEDLTLHTDAKKVPGLSEIRNRVAEGKRVSPQTVQYLMETDQIETEGYFEFLAEELGVDPDWERASTPPDEEP